jgi:hypothetical protein
VNWETLAHLPQVVIRRHGRFVVADLGARHRTISTSARNGGQTDHVRHLVNHQSCEGAGHDSRFAFITGQGEEAYHDAVCAELGLPGEQTALMGTAADMNYAAVVGKKHEDVAVTAVVTAGVQTNATCAGDPASWDETRFEVDAGLERRLGRSCLEGCRFGFGHEPFRIGAKADAVPDPLRRA